MAKLVYGVGFNDKTRPAKVDGKKKNNNEEQEPYWREINLGYLRGSGGLEQLAFNVVAVENEVMPDGTRGRVRLKVLKNREWGDLCIVTGKQIGRAHV